MQIGTQTSSSEHKMKKCCAPPTFTCARMQCHEAASYGCSIPVRKDFLIGKYPIELLETRIQRGTLSYMWLDVDCLKLCACVYIYIWQLSSFRASTLWFIDMTAATCHIQYTFLILCPFFNRENGQNENTRSTPFKWSPTVARRAKHEYVKLILCCTHASLFNEAVKRVELLPNREEDEVDSHQDHHDQYKMTSVQGS